jgi:N-acetylmuramic acid 6-phosphate etherase
MIRLGKTYGNLMVDVQTGSDKLRDRALRIVAIVTGLEPEDAGALLERAKWDVKAAIVMKKAGVTFAQAQRKLKAAHDSIRDALGEDLEPTLRQLLARGDV